MACKEYMFHLDSEDLSQQILDKFKMLGHYSKSSGIVDKVSKIYNFYYGRMMKTDSKIPGIGTAGESGEFATLNANHMRNILKHIMSIVLQNKLSFDAQAINGDVENRNNAVVANYVLDYYFSEKRFDKECKRALELAIIGTTSWLGVFWDPYKRIIGVDSEGNPIYKGAPYFKAYDIFSVISDPFKDRWEDQNWYAIREMENRWDIIGKYPHLEEKIKSVPKIQDIQRYDPFLETNEDVIFVYHVYHKPTPSLPTGRHLCFCENVVLYDVAYEYGEDLNMLCLKPDTVYGSMYGHTPAEDLLPIQEAMSLLDSTILSNQKAFGTQNIASPRQANINIADLDAGMRHIEFDADPDLPNGGLPQPLQLCATPNEIFRHRESLKADMEQISAINAAVRGMPPTQLTSGTAIALVATQASTYNSVLEDAYFTMVAEAATLLLKVLSMYMVGEELLAISGKGNEAPIMSFKADTFRSIARVKVDLGNALSKTLAGRVNLADTMLNNKVISTPEEYLDLISTGQTKRYVETKTSEIGYINIENEMLRRGIKPNVVYIDNPARHILEHRALTFDPTIRNKSEVLAVVLEHIMEHMKQLDEMSVQNPTLLTLVTTGSPVLPQPLPETRVMNTNNPEAASGNADQVMQQAQQDSGELGSTDAQLALEDGGIAAAQAGLSRAMDTLKQAQMAQKP